MLDVCFDGLHLHDTSAFIFGRLHRHYHVWVSSMLSVSGFKVVRPWLRDGVDIPSFFRHFEGVFQRPRSRLFHFPLYVSTCPNLLGLQGFHHLDNLEAPRRGGMLCLGWVGLVSPSTCGERCFGWTDQASSDPLHVCSRLVTTNPSLPRHS